MFANDIFFLLAKSDKWDLNDLLWDEDLDDKVIRSQSIDIAIKQIREHRIYSVMQSFAREVVKADWRTPSADFSDDANKRLIQTQYKGGSGYSMVWKNLIGTFQTSEDKILVELTSQLAQFMK